MKSIQGMAIFENIDRSIKEMPKLLLNVIKFCKQQLHNYLYWI